MRKLIIISITIFITVSCIDSNHKAYFEISNKSSGIITDIKVSNGVNTIQFDTLIPNKTKNVVLEFIDIPRVDGGYQIYYKLNSKSEFESFGYYSNGVPTNSVYKLVIKKDTVLITEHMK